MANRPGPQRALGSRGQTINATTWPYFDGLIRKVSAVTGVAYDTLIVEGTRTYERQKFLYENRNKPGFNPAYPPDSPYAYHVAGDAVDFGAGAGTRGTPVQKALHQYGASFGIFFEVASELWHGRCDLSRAPNLDPAAGGLTPIEDDDMTAEQYDYLKKSLDILGDNIRGIQASLDIVGDQNRGTQTGLNAIGDTTRATLDGVNKLGDYERQSIEKLDKIQTTTDSTNSRIDKTVNIILTKVWTITNNIATKVGSKRED